MTGHAALAVALLACAPVLALAQAVADPCFAAAARVRPNVTAPTAADMRSFLRSFSDARCTANTEYAEAGNEWLFDALEARPALFFGALFALSAPEQAAVRAQVEAPVHDCINVSRRVEAVRTSAAMPEDLRRRGLEFLERAYRGEQDTIRAWEAQNRRAWDWKDCAR